MKLTTKDITLASLFIALFTIGSKITIPSPIVPFSLQWMFVALSGVFLGPMLAPMSVIAYIALGLIGLPVFTKGGGISYLFSPSFGYLIGFILASFIIGKMTESSDASISFKRILVSMLAGLFGLYLVGTLYMYMIMNIYMGSGMSIQEIIWYGAILFIPTDLLFSVLCSFLCVRVVNQIRAIVKN